MLNKVLIDKLIADNLLDEEIGRKLLQEASFTKRDVGEIIHERKLISEKKLLEEKSKILKIPYVEIDPKDISDNLLKLLPEQTVRNFKVAPISKDGDMLVVGMVNPDDGKAQEALKFIAQQNRLNLGIYLVSLEFWEEILRRYSPYRSDITAAVKAVSFVGNKKLFSQQKVTELESGAAGEDAPIIKIVASTLKEAVFEKASDIHIEPQRNRLRIRFRIDGNLKEVASMPIELHQPIVSRIKVLSELKIDETRIPQDGRFRTLLLGRDIDFRVATFPTPVGEKVAIRVLDPTVGLRGLEELGIIGDNLEIIKEEITKPFGMILITGPTGSGKTTTLYAIMQKLNTEKVNIVSLEDPVEYYIDGLNQSQVKPEIGYTFASGLRQILRQDPDIIMVGEIRDGETAELAVHAALTGHIVLSTLHTNNSIGVVPRLIDMGIKQFLIPPSTNLMIAQRLIPKLCQKCLVEEKITPKIKEIINKEIEQMTDSVKENLDIKESYKIYTSKGCDACNGKGISGRIAIFEMLRMTDELRDIVSDNPTEEKIIKEAKRQKMITLRQDGIAKALKGLVSFETIVRETEEL